MDKYDILYLLDGVRKMPFHSDNMAKIPHSYEMRFPKSLSDESHKIQKKYLDNNLGKLEEADSKKILPNNFKMWLSNQLHKYHAKSDIFNQDNWVNSIKSLIPPQHVLSCGFLINSSIFYVRPPQPNPLEISAGATSHGNFGDTDMLCSRGAGGFAGDLYNQIAVRVYTSTMNWKLGVYSDSSVAPDDLIAPEIAASIDNSYTLHSITEFALTDSTPWIACRPYTDNNTYWGTGGNKAYVLQSYASAFPNPITSIRATNTDTLQCKIGHT